MKEELELVTVARFTDYMRADLARQMLEEQGIKAVVTGQNVGNVYSGLPGVVDIKLQTFAGQAEEAKEILKSLEPQEQPQEDFDLPADEEQE